MTHVDYCFQDFISVSDYVRLIGNVSLDFFLYTDASALLFFYLFIYFGCPGSSLILPELLLVSLSITELRLLIAAASFGAQALGTPTLAAIAHGRSSCGQQA